MVNASLWPQQPKRRLANDDCKSLRGFRAMAAPHGVSGYAPTPLTLTPPTQIPSHHPVVFFLHIMYYTGTEDIFFVYLSAPVPASTCVCQQLLLGPCIAETKQNKQTNKKQTLNKKHLPPKLVACDCELVSPLSCAAVVRGELVV